MAADIRLLATDLDGTVIGGANELPLYTEFRDQLRAMRASRGTVWVACTGRSRRSFAAFAYPMEAMNIFPDYIIVRNAFISRLTPLGYMPHVFWNWHIRYLIWLNRFRLSGAIEDWYRILTGAALGVRTLHRTKNRLHLRFESEESAQAAVDILRSRVSEYRHLQLLKYHRELDIRHVPFTKGLAVSELARHLGIEPAHILTVGNGLNDISMLDPAVAKMTACPANSEPEVMERVHASGGHLASHRSLRGVIEILKAYEEGTVSSELPPSWVAVSERPNPQASRPRRSRPGMNRQRAWLIAAVSYATVLVFANFNLIPFVSQWIMKPHHWLLAQVAKVLGLIWK